MVSSRILAALLTVFVFFSTGVGLARSGEQADLPDGLKALKHPDPKVRYKSVALLAKLGGNAKFITPVLREMLKDPDAAVRLKVAETLWILDRPPSSLILPILKNSLTHEDAKIRLEGLVLAEKMGKYAKEVVPEVEKALQDKDFNIKLQAILTVAGIGASAKSTIPTLLEILREDETGFLQASVAVALSQIGTRAVPHLRKALSDATPKVRRGAAYALSLIGPRAYQAVPELTDALQDKNPLVQAFAAQALGNIGADAEPSAPQLEKALQAKNAGTKISAALALWQIQKSEAGVPVLAQAVVEESDYFDRINAAKNLGRIGPPAHSALPSLMKGLNDKSYGVRAACCQALGLIGEKARSASPQLEKRLADDSGLVKVQAALALCRGQKAVQKKWLLVLADGLQDSSAMVRKEAAAALGSLGMKSRAVLPALTKRLRDPNLEVQDAARNAIKAIDPKLAQKMGIE